jgi:hypothetical protein
MYAANHKKSLDAAKAKNGGSLPSDLYNLTNVQLAQIILDKTGDDNYLKGRTPKADLVKLVLKLTAEKPTSTESETEESATEPKKKAAAKPASKRKATEASSTSSSSETETEPAKKLPRGCLPALTGVQIAQMKHILTITPDQLKDMRHEHELKPLWISAGETAKYPHMSPKEAVLERLKTFAEHNLKFHGLIEE